MDRGSLFIQTLGTVKHAQGQGPFDKDPLKFKRLCMEQWVSERPEERLIMVGRKNRIKHPDCLHHEPVTRFPLTVSFFNRKGQAREQAILHVHLHY